MKILLWIVIIIALIVGIIVIVPAFINPEVKISKTITVDKPVNVVFNTAKNFEHYREWNVWSKMDPDATGNIEGTPGEIGSKWNWQGEIIGTGSLTIKDFEENKSITNTLEFIAPMPAVADDLWSFEMIDSSTTKIDWTVSFNMEGYFERYGALFIEGELGPQLEQGLQNFKEYVEGMPDKKQMEEMETMEEER